MNPYGISPQAYSANLQQAMMQQVENTTVAQLEQAAQQILNIEQMGIQLGGYEGMSPYAQMGQVTGAMMPPIWQPGQIPSPYNYQQAEQASPPGMTDPPPGQGWPNGTKVTPGGLIVEPNSDGSTKIFNSNASGPKDTNNVLFTVKNDKVTDASGKEVFDLQQGGVLKLNDGSVLSSAVDSNGTAHVNLIANNSRETYTFGASGVDSASSQDGSSFLQSQLGTSAIQGNTYGVNVTDTGNVNFYKLQGGQVLGKVTGTAWQVDPQKLQTLGANIIQTINSAFASSKDHPGFHLNPDDYTNLIKGNDISAFLQKLNLDINNKLGVNYNFSNLTPDMHITNANQLKDLVDNLNTDLKQNADTGSGKHTHEDHQINENVVNQLSSLVASNPVGSDWGQTAATVDPNDTNFLVTPPQYKPQMNDPSYPNQFTNNLNSVVGGNPYLPPQLQAYFAGGGGQELGPWANQFGGGLYNPQMSFPQQVGQAAPMWNAYNNYSSMASGLPAGYTRG